MDVTLIEWRARATWRRVRNRVRRWRGVELTWAEHCETVADWMIGAARMLHDQGSHDSENDVFSVLYSWIDSSGDEHWADPVTTRRAIDEVVRVLYRDLTDQASQVAS